MSRHEFLILGANFAGVGVAHYILRHTIPALQKVDSSAQFHVTIVNPSTHYFFKIASPRILVSPDLIPIEKAIIPLVDGFKEYTSDQWTFVLGTAKNLDTDSRTVTVETDSGSPQKIPYSSLIIATGTSANSALWTLNGSHDITVQALKRMQSTLPSARTILIAGGGTVGVETAGEIATLYPIAKTTIASSGTRLLSRLKISTSKDAEACLKKLKVEVVNNLKITSSSVVQDGKATEVTFSNGSTRTVDVYIDATGGRPNSSYLPQTWLDENGFVLTDNKTLRVTAPNAEGVYAIGDVANYSEGTAIDVQYSVAPLGTTIAIDVAASLGTDKPIGIKQKNFKPMRGTQVVPIGPSGGVGQLFGWRIPSLMVWGLKARTYFIEKMPGAVSGEDYRKA